MQSARDKDGSASEQKEVKNMSRRLAIITLLVWAMIGVNPILGQSFRIIPKERLDSIANPVAASDSPMRFEQTRIDAGTISEDDAPSQYRFVWHNEGSEPLVITEVRTGCGCAVATYDHRPVKSGEKGTITVTYNPKGHPGRFQRKIVVSTQLLKASAVLELTGDVIPSSRPVHDYHNAIGSLRLKQLEVRMSGRDRAIESIEVMNAGEKPMRIEADAQMLPQYLRVVCVPETIEAGARADIEIHFDPSKVKGTIPRQIPVILNGIGNLPPSRRTIHINFEQETER